MSWAAPLLVLPGVGLLIMSTSTRYIRLHDELHHVVEHGHMARNVAMLLRRAKWFRNALVAAYISVMFLVLSGLVLGAEAAVDDLSMMPDAVGHGLAFLGVVALLASSGFLCVEAAVSYSVLEEHAAEVMQEPPAERSSAEGP